MSRLSEVAIEGEKIVQADGRWAIGVDREASIPALTFLDSARVLSARGRSEVAKVNSPLIPNREEQWFRYESSVAGAIEETLMTLPGVVEARVHLNLPQSDPLLGNRSGAVGSASVLILSDRAYAANDDEVSALVAGAAGLGASSVKVLRSPALSAEKALQGARGMGPTVVSEEALAASPIGQLAPSTNSSVPRAITVRMCSVFGAACVLIITAVVYRRRKNSKNPFELLKTFDHEG